MNKKDIKITLYESWMHDQVVQLFCHGFGYDKEHWRMIMKYFYEDPYQVKKCLRIVALDGKKVAGFFSYIYQPYLFKGQHLNVYSASNAVVASSYRRSGIFSRMLKYLDVIKQHRKIDFLIACYPEVTSYKSFLQNNFSDILCLDKYVKLICPFSLLRRFDISKISLDKEFKSVTCFSNQEGLTLKDDIEFEAWRKSYSKDNDYFYFYYNAGSHFIRFDLKITPMRLRGIKIRVLTVGRVTTNTFSHGLLNEAVKHLVGKVRAHRIFALLYVALNSRYYKPEILQAFIDAGFKRVNTEGKLRFLIKNFSGPKEVFHPELWELYKSDKDTW